MIVYNKLIRDKIPEIIEGKGKNFTCHKADDREYLNALREKIKEEVEEFYEDPSTEEMGDILEVLHALMDYHNLDKDKDKDKDKDEVEKIREDKARERGKFEKQLILESVEG